MNLPTILQFLPIIGGVMVAGLAGSESQKLETYTLTFDKNDKVLSGLLGVMADAGAQVTMSLKTKKEGYVKRHL